jgi:uncharacterized membrane protein
VNSPFATLAMLIEFGGALVIAKYVAQAGWSALLQRSPHAAAQIATRGLVAGLNFKLAATLLKTLELTSWNQIGMFVTIFALRLLVKRALLANRRA